jgi:hypothetical protein
MAQLFSKNANILSKVVLILIVSIVFGGLFGLALINRSSVMTYVGVVKEQPVPFSHKRHVGGAGIDCRYCHTTVETEAFAGIPPTETCMNCHSVLFLDSGVLEPVRTSYLTGNSLEWTRINDMPDHVYFDHSIHIKKGIGCVSCHGKVDEMEQMAKTETLFMEFCLECHKNPAKYVRPREHVFDMKWRPAEDQETLGNRLVKEYKIESKLDCYTCHR